MAVQGPSRAGRPCRQSRTITQTQSPLPPQPPPERRRMLLHPRDIVPQTAPPDMRTQCRAGSTLLLSAEPTQRSCSPPLGSLLTVPTSTPRVRPRSPGAWGNGTATARAALPAHEKTERSAHEETTWRTVHIGSKNINTVQQFVYTGKCAGAARRRRGWRLACSKRNFRILPADAERRFI